MNTIVYLIKHAEESEENGIKNIDESSQIMNEKFILSVKGEEQDCYVLGIFEPIDEFEGKCIAVIHRIYDDDDKLIIIPNDKYYSSEAIEASVEFQEQFFEHEIIKS